MAAVCTMLAACGADATGGPPTSAGGGGSASTGSEASAGYPVTIENCGHTLTFDKPPSRALLSYLNLVETFVGLGLGDHAIGRALSPGQDIDALLPLLPSEVAAIQKIPVVSETAFPPPREQMLALRPDFVLAWGESDYSGTSGLATVEQLKELGVQPYTNVCPQESSRISQSITYRTILDLGKIFNVSQRAQARVAQMQQQIADVQATVSQEPPVKVLAYYSGFPTDGPLEVAGGGIITELLSAAGAANVFSDKDSFPQPSREAIAARPADVFLILGNASSNSEAHSSGAASTADAKFLFTTFPNMPASSNQRVIVLPDLAAEPGSWRIAEFVTALARYLHPNAFAGK